VLKLTKRLELTVSRAALSNGFDAGANHAANGLKQFIKLI